MIVSFGGWETMHTYVKEVNGYKIMYWSAGNVYYVRRGEEWVFENKELKVIEELCMKR